METDVGWDGVYSTIDWFVAHNSCWNKLKKGLLVSLHMRYITTDCTGSLVELSMDNGKIDDILADYDSRDYSSYQPEEAESLRQLDRTVKGIIIEATIMTKMDKEWRK